MKRELLYAILTGAIVGALISWAIIIVRDDAQEPVEDQTDVVAEHQIEMIDEAWDTVDLNGSGGTFGEAVCDGPAPDSWSDEEIVAVFETKVELEPAAEKYLIAKVRSCP